ncbi:MULTISPECIES: GNAT family N-acetyltransferase [unclassified Beijerinckia]|uniref:GNAT family N-acetyltransferase n=1 Tax=unclassified Beijerinckia TaxID=2638183 RepID=UPI001FCD6682|nr:MULTISPECIES: GNAT family N-acetyltransferase [unclassified Beijerinckia]
MSDPVFQIRIARSMADIDAAAWDACANPPGVDCDPDDPQRERFNPFLSHAFLNTLETSGSATSRTGWSPVHLVVEDQAGAILACAPCYLKNHSQGEYVFDYAWADAFERAGGHYYPKLQVSVPFTPAQGRRLLVAPGTNVAAAQAALVEGLRALQQRTGASSTHITFPLKQEWEALGQNGFLRRTGKQFHFFNRGYDDFDGFLADLASRKRKNIRKERAEAIVHGIDIEWVTGRDITEAHWDAFFAFYMDTGSRKWGQPYLTRRYYSLVGEAMADRILLVMAKRNGRYIAGAINFIGDDALYGRNWGAIEEHPFLHFEVCYYQAIDFAIARKLSRVEAGAQGEHKLARGYGPVETYSLHMFEDPRLARAVDGFLQQEREAISQSIEIYGEHVPFRRDLERELD